MQHSLRGTRVLRGPAGAATAGRRSPVAPAHRHRGQQGAVLVEAALVLPVLFLFLIGIMEFGLVYASGATANGSTRSGARLAATNYATAGGTSSAQRLAADDIAAAVGADLETLSNAQPIGMTIYKVTGADGGPAGGFPGDDLTGGCSSNCFRYRWNGSAMVYQSGGWSNPDACGPTVDSIGVFVQVRHDYLTDVIGSTRTVNGHTVMRLEPLPTDQCTG